MCGIFGYVGQGRDATEAVMEGLRRLDYRGYDSWGVAVLDESVIKVEKQVGIVAKERPTLPETTIGIGHTRWATHGKVNVPNAHPHYSTDKSFVLCQNGIVENVESLKAMLITKGYEFFSETDTEVIVRLVEEKRKRAKSLEEAVRLAFNDLEGRNTIIVLADNGDIVVCRDRAFTVFAIDTGKKLKPLFEKNLLKDVSVDKRGHPHFMEKEIEEAPFVIRQVVAEEDAKYKKLAAAIKKARTVYCIGSGTAGAAAAQTAYYLRTYGRINARELIGAEAHEYEPLIGKGDLLLAPSQSGETADVLEVLEHAKRKDASIASHVNMPGSMMTRMSDFAFMANAGPEICFMSTKIFVSQIAWGYLVAKAVEGKLAEGKKNLLETARTIEKMLANKDYVGKIKHLAQNLSK